MKKASVLFLALAMILSISSVGAFASESNCVYYDDGSYDLITVEAEDGVLTRATSSKTGTVTREHYSANNVLEWKISMKATFTYNGQTSSCTVVNRPVITIYDSDWSVYSNTYSKSGNTATGNVTMERDQLIGSVQVPVTLTLSCDKNGNLS